MQENTYSHSASDFANPAKKFLKYIINRHSDMHRPNASDKLLAIQSSVMCRAYCFDT